eukprot:scaffold269667_cov35-Tisochrysis_lutea.AAC.1
MKVVGPWLIVPSVERVCRACRHGHPPVPSDSDEKRPVALLPLWPEACLGDGRALDRAAEGVHGRCARLAQPRVTALAHWGEERGRGKLHAGGGERSKALLSLSLLSLSSLYLSSLSSLSLSSDRSSLPSLPPPLFPLSLWTTRS